VSRGTLFKLTDQREREWLVAAPTMERAIRWLENHVEVGGVVQMPHACKVEVLGTLAAVIVGDAEHAVPTAPEAEDRQERQGRLDREEMR